MSRANVSTETPRASLAARTAAPNAAAAGSVDVRAGTRWCGRGGHGADRVEPETRCPGNQFLATHLASISRPSRTRLASACSTGRAARDEQWNWSTYEE